MTKLLSIILIASVLASCAGRTPEPVAIVQPVDVSLTCADIIAEIKANNGQIQQLSKEQDWKVTQNVVAGVVGLVVPILWFGMDFQGAATKEEFALNQRQERLSNLLIEKQCK